MLKKARPNVIQGHAREEYVRDSQKCCSYVHDVQRDADELQGQGIQRGLWRRHMTAGVYMQGSPNVMSSHNEFNDLAPFVLPGLFIDGLCRAQLRYCSSIPRMAAGEERQLVYKQGGQYAEDHRGSI